MDFTNHTIPPDHLSSLQKRLSGWSARLRAAGLEGLVGALMDAAEPLSPLGAQVLWVAQPTLRLFIPAGEIDGLARLLDDPAGLVWLRETLAPVNDTVDAEPPDIEKDSS